MTFSTKFYDYFNSIEDFDQLNDDDPRVIKLQKMRAAEMNEEYRPAKHKKVVKKGGHTAGNVYDETTISNLTEDRYVYMVQRGVSRGELQRFLKIETRKYSSWIQEKGLIKDNMQVYQMVKDDVVLGEFLSIKSISKAIGKSDDYTRDCYVRGRKMVNGCYIKLLLTRNPTIEEVNDFKYEDTLAYWLENDYLLKRRAR